MRIKTCGWIAAGAALGLGGVHAGAQAHEALVISDPSDATALWVANHYAEARGIPASGFAWFNPFDSSFQATVTNRHAALYGHLTTKGTHESIDYIVLGALDKYRVSASGLVSDSCSPVNRFSLTGAYTIAPFADEVLAGGYASTAVHGFFSGLNTPVAFDANETYDQGMPGSTDPEGNLFIAASLGYTGERGVSGQTIVDMIDRSVAADGQLPGFLPSFLFIRTTDAFRSGPRQGLFDQAVDRIIAAGFPASETFPGPLPPNNVQMLGVMTGAANLDFASTNFTLVNGAFADHLTSWGADFNLAQQTKCSAWIERGAVGTFGTVEEPCNYAQKFPSAYLHSHYAQGVTLGEAALRSLAAIPFQGYLMGDPLCRPYATGPDVTVTGLPGSPVSGSVSVTVNATATRAGFGLGSAQVLVDGALVDEGPVGTTFVIPTSQLDDGWHELRAIVVDDSPQEVIGEWIGSFTLANSGLSASMTPTPSSGDRDTVFTFAATWPAGTVDEVRVLHLGRVVAAGDGTQPLQTRGEILGAGPARVWAEVDFTDGTTVVTEPTTIEIANVYAGTGTGAPAAQSYTKRVVPGTAFVMELPGDFAETLDEMSYNVTSTPTQSSALGGERSYRIYQADANATGSETLTFTINNGSQGSIGRVTLEYVPIAPACLADVNGDGVASPADFNAWIIAFNNQAPGCDQNGDGACSPADFNAWVLNYNAGC